MQCTRHATTYLFQYITYCHFCWIAVQYKTIQYSKDTTCVVTHNMSGHTTTECPHKSWKMYKLEISWNCITNRTNILDHIAFLHAYTNTPHYMWVIRKTSGSKSNYRGDRALVTAASCPSDGEGSPRLNWKALQSNKVHHHWSKYFYFHIKFHTINFSGLTPFVSRMHHIKDDLLVKYTNRTTSNEIWQWY